MQLRTRNSNNIFANGDLRTNPGTQWKDVLNHPGDGARMRNSNKKGD